jgi:hypothetical protein
MTRHAPASSSTEFLPPWQKFQKGFAERNGAPGADAGCAAVSQTSGVPGAANETHADCLRIITRAEMRMANEVDRGQSAGEIAGVGKRSNTRISGISEMADLGIPTQRLAEWRDVRRIIRHRSA